MYSVSVAFRDALDERPIDDSDDCCLIELTTQSGERLTRQHSGEKYLFQSVPAGTAHISVKPYSGYADQTRQITISSNTAIDFQLVPLPVLLGGEVLDARTEARAPRCTAKIEILDGPDAGRVTSPTTGPNYQFSEPLQPATANIRFSAPGGYETKVNAVRLRGRSPDGSMSVYASLACPGCALYGSMTCP
jgi:hypothetical protein